MHYDATGNRHVQAFTAPRHIYLHFHVHTGEHFLGDTPALIAEHNHDRAFREAQLFEGDRTFKGGAEHRPVEFTGRLRGIRHSDINVESTALCTPECLVAEGIDGIR